MLKTRLARIGAEAAWVTAGQLLAFLGGFATIKFLTGELGPGAYGQLALGISAAGAIHMFVYGPIEQIALRFVSVYRERGQLHQLFAALRRLHLYAATIVGAAIVVVTATLYALAGTTWSMLILLALLLGVGGGVSTTLSSLLSAFRQRASVAFFQASDVWLRLLLAIAGLAWLGTSADAALIGFCLATATTAIVQLAWVMRNPLVRPHLHGQAATTIGGAGSTMRELVAYGRPYLAFAAFAWFSTYCDRWVILGYLDERSVGIYAALLQIANAPIAIFLGMTNQFLVPLIFDRAGAATTQGQIRSSAQLLNAAMAAYVLGLTVIVCTAALVAEPLVRLLTSAEFSRHADLLWVICLGLSLSSTAQLLVIKGLSHGRPQQYVLPKFVQLVLLIASMLVLVQPLALMGVAVSLCISGAGYLAMVAWVNSRLVTHAT